MARTVKPEAFAAKRKEILDAARRLVLTRGFEQVAIQDILNEIQISSGAFHHYFDSRADLLEGLVEHMQGDVEQPLLPILRDPRLSAIDKLQRFFDILDQLRTERKDMVVDLLRVWFADDNAVVRQKVDEMIVQRRAPLLTEIVRQGIAEGVFTTAYPDQAGEVILALLHGMGSTHARLLLALDQDGAAVGDLVNTIVTTHAAYLDAIERVLGAPSGSLARTGAEAVQVWVTALRGDER